MNAKRIAKEKAKPGTLCDSCVLFNVPIGVRQRSGELVRGRETIVEAMWHCQNCGDNYCEDCDCALPHESGICVPQWER